MSILWTGGEDIDFIGRVTTNTGTTNRRSTYSRCCIYPVSETLRSAVPFIGGAVTSCWLSAWSICDTTANVAMIGLGNSGNSDYRMGLWIKSQASSRYKLAITTFDGSSWTEKAVSATDVFDSTGTVRKLDLQVTSYGASATVTAYVSGVQCATYTGNIQVGSPAMSSIDTVLVGGRIDGAYTAMSEMIVADEDTRPMALHTSYPNAAGDSNQFTGTYDYLDDNPMDDTDLIYVNTNDQIALFNLVDAPAGVFQVKAIEIVARCAKSGDSTPTKIALGIKSGGSTDAGSDQSLAIPWGAYQRLMNTNPITSNPFTTAELTAMQLQLKSRA